MMRDIGFGSRVICAVIATMTGLGPLTPYAAGAQDFQGRMGSAERAQIQTVEQTSLEEAPLPDAEEIAPVEDLSAEAPVDDVTPTPGVEEAGDSMPLSLPGGDTRTSVNPQAISLPTAEGSIEGMGESFTPHLSSGTGSFGVPIAVAPGRGGVQPSFSLAYSTSGGNGPVGFGWGLSAPFISRQVDRGVPRYVDRERWHQEEDRFIYNGGQELVPVSSSSMSSIDRAGGYPDFPLPTELSTWQEYRARVEGGFMRFFRARDSQRWVVLSKDGSRFDFGLLPAGEGPSEMVSASSSALERDPDATARVYRWMLTRMVDAHGSPVWYRYRQSEGQALLSDVTYVSPASCAAPLRPEDARVCAEPLSAYAARVSFAYSARQDVFDSWVSGWRIATGERLSRVTVTAWDDTLGQRALVRRYHLTYDASSFHSLLTSVQLEGRPEITAHGVRVLGAPVAESALGPSIVGPTLPAMRFTYSEMPAGGIDTSIHEVEGSPPHSVDEARSELFDINSDGLPDLVVTDPARYRTRAGQPATGVFFNGFIGPDAQPAGHAASFSGAVPVPIAMDLSGTMAFSNPNIAPMDIDGDGRSDLLHMPRTRSYGWFTPTRAADAASEAAHSPAQQGWRWTFARTSLPERDSDPRIDLGRDGTHIVTMDVNGDHLIDVVRSTGDRLQTWLNLGWLSGGDGRFGTYAWAGSTATLSTQPQATCLPVAGTPLDFDDPEVRFGDMNGDGLQDIVRIRRGRVIYWPGRGDGSFGVGARGCAAGLVSGRHIEMATPPADLDIELSDVHLVDVDADGADDVLQVRFDAIDVWLNRAGRSFEPRFTGDGTPPNPSFTNRVRLVDIDGSGTVDVLYAEARNWQYVDLLGGRRPRLLVGVENGLGAETTMEYASSAEDYLRDLAQCASPTATSSGLTQCFAWSQPGADYDLRLNQLSPDRVRVHRSGGTPVISTIIRRVRTTDHLEALGREAQVSTAEFAYHEGYYEGIEQEFRGFGVTDAYAIGDWNHPTSITRTWFHQGRRAQSIADDRLAWNPDESLKGREYLTETLDENGHYLASAHATLTVRRLATGLDGRPIDYAFVSEANELRYDTTPFEPATRAPIELADVVRQEVSSAGTITSTRVERTRRVPVRGAREARIRTTFDEVDNLGHVLEQTAHGLVGTDSGWSDPETHIVSHSVPTRVELWTWRTAEGWVDGDGGTRLSHASTTFNDVGDAIESRQYVTGVVSLDFGGESAAEGGAMAMPQRAEPVIASVRYDAWGQPIVQCGGGLLMDGGAPTDATPAQCLRYGTITRDEEFEQLAVSERAWIGYGLSESLTTSGTWDRGLALVLSATAPNDVVSRMLYDGFGRPVAAIPPPVEGCDDDQPTVLIEYELTSDPRSQPLSRVRTTTVIRDVEDCDIVREPIVGIGYVDGLGRPRAALSTGGTDARDTSHDWVRSGLGTFDVKGTVRRTYQPDFYDGSEDTFSSVLALPADIPYAVVRYDAFGRTRGVIAEDGAVVWTSHHALSTDVCDPLDNDPLSAHYRTCTTARVDGHGRVIDQMLRNRDPETGALQHHRLWSWYRQDGAVLALARTQRPDAETRPPAPPTANETTVVRTFTYDSAGRRLTSSDPDTESRSGRPASARNWRYLFNRLGDLVAVRDPRGCGQNFFYDRGGRLLGEQYVSCAEAQSAAAERPTATVGASAFAMDPVASSTLVDVRYYYDDYAAASWSDAARSAATLAPTRGMPTGVEDRGQRGVVGYDLRGNPVWSARQMAVISDALTLAAPTSMTSLPPYLAPLADGEDDRPRMLDVSPDAGWVEYDEVHTYVRTAEFDHQGRAVSMELPLDPDFGAGGAPPIGGRLEYDSRGLPSRAIVVVGETDHDVIASIAYARDGAVERLVWGDGRAGHDATVSETEYDVRRRPIRMRTVREPTADEPGDEGTLGAVETVVDQELAWDAASNLTDIYDHRDGAEWGPGFRPRTIHVSHDSLYRVVDAYFEYTGSDGRRTQDDASSDYRDTYAQLRNAGVDPMSTEPAPMVPERPPERPESMSWSFDFLGNSTSWTDDSQLEEGGAVGSFYERSIGAIANGLNVPEGRPSALYFATNITTPIGEEEDGGAGWLEVDYGEGGNVIAMTVHGQCGAADGEAVCTQGDSAALSARRASLRSTCECAVEQHYEYHWDELDRIAEARRWDRNGGAAAWTLAVRQRYRYDGANQRTVKQTLEPVAADAPITAGGGQERIALYAYPGDFERRGLARSVGANGPEYVRGPFETETQYVVAGARLVWRNVSGAAEQQLENRRLTVALTDLIQTTGAVMDLWSGDLVEASTYYPNGGRETYLVDSSSDWTAHGLAAPEPTGFTGKEADEEVGLVYFGERYLIPRIGRWASPDPLHVHASGGGEVMNSYHYVSAGVLQQRDALGLDGEEACVDRPDLTPNYQQGWKDGAETARRAASAIIANRQGWSDISQESDLSIPPDALAEQAMARQVIGEGGIEYSAGGEGQAPGWVAVPIQAGAPADDGGEKYAVYEQGFNGGARALPLSDTTRALVGVEYLVRGIRGTRSARAGRRLPEIWTTAQVGQYAESTAARFLEGAGLEGVMSLQNASGHGLDVTGTLSLAEAGSTLVVVEVKGTRGRHLPELSEAQYDMYAFVRSRLETLRSDRTASREVRARAARYLRMMENGTRVVGMVISVIRVGHRDERTVIHGWQHGRGELIGEFGSYAVDWGVVGARGHRRARARARE